MGIAKSMVHTGIAQLESKDELEKSAFLFNETLMAAQNLHPTLRSCDLTDEVLSMWKNVATALAQESVEKYLRTQNEEWKSCIY